MGNLRKNFIYNIMYQLLVLFLPFITVPYVSRVIGATGVGIYSYNYSIVYYFMLISLLGINNYGNRSIAKVRSNKDELSKTFISIYMLQFIMSSIMITLYYMYILFFNKTYKTVALIQIIFIFSSMFDINWFFFGMEQFKLTVTRNTIIKVLSLILVFVFVKNSDDLNIYTVIMALSMLISKILLWPFVFKYVEIKKVRLKDILKHLKPCLILFIPVIAVSLYKIMDKIMLGSLSTVTQVGYYENAEKIINIPMTIITALGTVMLPRMTNLISEGKIDKIKEYIEKSLKLVMFMAFPICFGIAAIASEFVPLFLGESFNESIKLVIYLSSTIIFISWANVIRTQYLIPTEKDKDYIISVFLGAFINLVMNIIFIPRYNALGACFGTIAAELTVMLYQTITVRKELNIGRYITNSKSFFIKSIIMYVCVKLCVFINISSVYLLVIQVFTGVIVYSLLNIRYINEVINLNKVIKKVLSI